MSNASHPRPITPHLVSDKEFLVASLLEEIPALTINVVGYATACCPEATPLAALLMLDLGQLVTELLS